MWKGKYRKIIIHFLLHNCSHCALMKDYDGHLGGKTCSHTYSHVEGTSTCHWWSCSRPPHSHSVDEDELWLFGVSCLKSGGTSRTELALLTSAIFLSGAALCPVGSQPPVGCSDPSCKWLQYGLNLASHSSYLNFTDISMPKSWNVLHSTMTLLISINHMCIYWELFTPVLHPHVVRWESVWIMQLDVGQILPELVSLSFILWRP